MKEGTDVTCNSSQLSYLDNDNNETNGSNDAHTNNQRVDNCRLILLITLMLSPFIITQIIGTILQRQGKIDDF